jgi:hypothetical protein
MLDTGVLFKARLLSVKQITSEHPQLTRSRGEVALTPTNCRLEFSALKSTRTQWPICSTELHSIIIKTSKSNQLLGLPVLSLYKTVRSLNNFFTETTSCCKVCPSIFSPFLLARAIVRLNTFNFDTCVSPKWKELTFPFQAMGWHRQRTKFSTWSSTVLPIMSICSLICTRLRLRTAN